MPPAAMCNRGFNWCSDVDSGIIACVTARYPVFFARGDPCCCDTIGSLVRAMCVAVFHSRTTGSVTGIFSMLPGPAAMIRSR